MDALSHSMCMMYCSRLFWHNSMTLYDLKWTFRSFSLKVDSYFHCLSYDEIVTMMTKTYHAMVL